MIVKIKDSDYELHYSMRIYIFYENIMGKGIDEETMKSYTSLVMLFFSTILATLQFNHKNIDFDYNDFLDWIDENGGVHVINDFAKWFMEQIAASAAVTPIKEPTEKEKKQAKKSKNA